MALVDLMGELAGGEAPALWSGSMVGFGRFHYRYASGREGDTFKVGFAPRKTNLTIYLMTALADNADLLERLGPHKAGKGCLYLKRLNDVDRSVLSELISRSVRQAEASDRGSGGGAVNV